MADMDKEREALFELQEKLNVCKNTQAKISHMERIRTSSKTKQELTLKEITSLPDSTVVYKSVGKAYFISSKPQVVSELDDDIKALSTEIDNYKQQKTTIDQKAKSVETELRELVKNNPNLIRQMMGKA